MENLEALNVLKLKLKEGAVPARDLGFVGDLVAKSAKLSEKQWYWVVRMAEKLSPSEAPKVVADFTRVYSMFAAAQVHLKRPKVLLALPDGESVKLYVAGPTSRVPGVVNVVQNHADGDQTWFGRVHPDGRWEAGHGSADKLPAVEALLRRLADDPEKVAAEYGKLHGNCCFCSRPLNDPRSVEVGYGPVCASRFNLSWGGK